MSERPWVIVGCGKDKHPDPRPAADLYRSTYITRSVAWARSVTSEDRLLIFSAKHGLIDGRTVIAPYDVSFRGPTSREAVDRDTLARQAAAFGLTGPTITLAGLLYRGRLERATGGTVQPYNPIAEALRAEGKRPGIGWQMKALGEWTGRVPTT